jgi:hypothetical protein
VGAPASKVATTISSVTHPASDETASHAAIDDTHLTERLRNLAALTIHHHRTG